MTNKRKASLIAALLLLFTAVGIVYGRNMNKENGSQLTLNSGILKENRSILIHLPDNYESSGLSYPVIYRFDGDKKLMHKTVSDLSKLSSKSENIPDMIVVAIENTQRDRDMWPTHGMYYPESQPLGAENFLAFIEEELIPYVETNYRTTKKRIVCGQSLSAVFTLYTFLSKPYLFDSYIACSGAFPGCEPFFKELSNTAFQQSSEFDNKKLFITHGLKDPLDADGTIHRQMTDFSESVKKNLGKKVSCKYLFYEKEGHVPADSFRDGVAFLFDNGN